MDLHKAKTYDVIADPESSPKEIFISGFDSSPLSADYDFITKDQKENIIEAIKHLSKLTKGSVNISLEKRVKLSKRIKRCDNSQCFWTTPAGNLSTIINKVSPLIKVILFGL